MHIHLDPVGGIAGDMFVGAILDRWPEYAAELDHQLELADFAHLVNLETVPHGDGVLTGTLFTVSRGDREDVEDPHRKYSEIRHHLIDAKLSKGVLQLSLKIFHTLAEAEARVHGQPIDEVSFHEVGSWDSIADIVSAAFLIDALGEVTWSIGPVPIGNGFVESAHGKLPVPAPAVAILLEGFPVRDDGLPGERVTPTGAAIVRTLAPSFNMPPESMVLEGGGYGFGTKRFPGISNVLRLLSFNDAAKMASPSVQRWQKESVTVIQFEVDDQTPEELARGLELIRAQEGVIDVIQSAVIGKKGRQSCQVQVLADQDHAEQAIAGCFEQTTTLGVRTGVVGRYILPRTEVSVKRGRGEYRVKLATRPSGETTVKADIDDLSSKDRSQHQRSKLRAKVEKEAKRKP